MRWKWCTFQPYKVQSPTRKLLLWQVYTVRMKAILFYSTNMTWCFIYHIKVIPVANFPWLCPSSSKSCTLPSTRLPQQRRPTHSTQHSLLPGSQFTAGGLAARIAAPLRESPEWHETHRSFVLQRKVLPVHSTFGACPPCNTEGKTEADGTTETVGKT